MRKDELKKLREKNLKELLEKSQELRKQIQQKKLEAKAGKLKNVAEVAKFKKDLAQVLTITRMAEFAQKAEIGVAKNE